MQYLLTQEEFDKLKHSRLTDAEVKAFEFEFNKSAEQFVRELRPFFSMAVDNHGLSGIVISFVRRCNALTKSIGPKDG